MVIKVDVNRTVTESFTIDFGSVVDFVDSTRVLIIEGANKNVLAVDPNKFKTLGSFDTIEALIENFGGSNRVYDVYSLFQ